MDTFLKADIFFFITTIAVIIITILLIVVFAYLIGALKRFKALSKRIEKNIGEASEEVEELITRVSESTVFNFLFPNGKKRKKSKN